MWKCEAEGCHFQTVYKHLRQSHQDSQHDGIIHSCKICLKSFRNKSNIPAHMKSMHGTVKFQCRQCSYNTTNKINLRKHILSNHEEKKFNCSECKFKAGYITRLSQHMKFAHKQVLKSQELKKRIMKEKLLNASSNTENLDFEYISKRGKVKKDEEVN